MPVHPTFGAYTINRKGYVRLWRKPYRGWYLHRVVFTQVAGREPKEGFHIHHQPPQNKQCTCPHRLVELDPALHTHELPRCAFTGRFLTRCEIANLRANEVPF